MDTNTAAVTFMYKKKPFYNHRNDIQDHTFPICCNFFFVKSSYYSKHSFTILPCFHSRCPTAPLSVSADRSSQAVPVEGTREEKLLQHN